MTAWRVLVRGTVQGVGFRPFVHRIATGLALDGTVRNIDGNVLIEVRGAAPAVAELTRALREQAPPHAVVADITVTPAATRPLPAGFTVEPSAAEAGGPGHGFTGLPVDLAVCEDCLREMSDPADRRYRYPFINCTACGPRATIIDALPYDRVRTAMADFTMCERCSAEYHDPTDRRFHAEPIACPGCGPTLSWHTPTAEGPDSTGEHALAAAVQALRAGQIVALKGLGGYQLVCDATNAHTVTALRARKQRPRKPLAVMVADLAAAQRIGWLTEADTALLATPARPIVLVAARRGPTAALVHPGTDRIGLFLPATPLHHLLVRELVAPLVVTSGNRSDEPIAIDDADAATRLAPIADGFLWHDRPIRARYDDSVVRVIAGERRTVRRARGYAPASLPLLLPIPAGHTVLAVGAQLKHTFTLARGDRALVGPHGGSLADADALAAFQATRDQLCRLHRFEPEFLAHDLHPGYLSTQYATETVSVERRIPVQHHHAHVASCAAENGIDGPFLGVAYDGLGLGSDGMLWGGEILLASYTGYRRLGRFSTAPLPGGEAAVRRPARMALGYLYGAEFPVPAPRPGFLNRIDPRERDTIHRMVSRNINSPRASSAGRLFDAVASLLGVCDDAGYEGEAAVMLEAAAAAEAPAALPWRLTEVDGLWVYDCAVTLGALLAGTAAGEPVGRLAAAFHRTIVEVTVALCERAAERTGVRTVCLSGGCLQNGILATDLPRALAAAGLDARLNREIPAGDGGISYGQAVIAAARMGKEG